MPKHDCGCVTHWDDELNHPMYDKVCFGHRPQMPAGWLVEKKPSRPRESVQASA